ncbi:hypothetical protein GEMRC1_001672 [Eukaryota sp. GEM-RC1]
MTKRLKKPSLLQVVVEELQNDDTELRLSSVRRLPTICKALGLTKSRDLLLPFLSELLKDDSDAVLAALAEQLPSVIPFIGGSTNAYLVLPILCHLLAEEDKAVHSSAIQSLIQVIPMLSFDKISTDLVPLLLKLSDDWFMAKANLCPLLPLVYKYADTQSREFVSALLSKMISDSAPFVRRAASLCLFPFLEELISSNAVSYLTSFYSEIKSLCEDEFDGVRINTIQLCYKLVTFLSNQMKVLLLMVDTCRLP